MTLLEVFALYHILYIHNHSCAFLFASLMGFYLCISSINRIPEYETTQNIQDVSQEKNYSWYNWSQVYNSLILSVGQEFFNIYIYI